MGPPATLMQAILGVAWGLPRWGKYMLLLGTIAIIGGFATWTSIPEKNRERAIEALMERSTKPEVIALPEARRRGLPVIFPGAATVAEMKELIVELRTTQGTITIELLPEVAPNHGRNFLDLATHGFYDGTRFHRVNPLFMVQGGDPNSKRSDRSTWGRGNGPRTLNAEFSDTPHERGTVSMARRSDDPDSASSQFFICLERKSELDGKQTVFGKVVQGMDVVERIAAGARDAGTDQPYHPVAIERAVVLRRSDRSEWNPHGTNRHGQTSR